jgi:alkyldihydroxyacetonephosphate synthase
MTTDTTPAPLPGGLGEMHPQRWGAPTAATDLPESARGLVEMAFGLHPTPAVETPAVPASALGEAPLAALRDVVGEQHVLLDDDVRRVVAEARRGGPEDRRDGLLFLDADRDHLSLNQASAW